MSANNDILSLSATEQRRLIGNGKLSSEQLVNASIARIEQINPAVNAVITTNFAEAKKGAMKADDAVREGLPLHTLHGLPVLVKDLTDTADLRTTYGSLCFADHIPANDAIIVEKLRGAGAIILGKTNTPEFGVGANTTNLLFGATGNPYQLSQTSGGSSGGSAAALACDMAPLATGSDLGGSLRIPASFCGVAGLRPTPGQVPSESNIHGFSPLWTDGPMARNVGDLAMLFSAICGADPRDPLSLPAAHFDADGLEPASDLSQYRAGFSTDLGFAVVDNAIARLFDDRKRHMKSYFGHSEETQINLSAAVEIFRILRAESLYAGYSDLVREQPDRVAPNLRANITEAETLTLADISWAHVEHSKLYRYFQRLLEDIDFLICPATALSPFPLDQNHPTQINGQPLDNYYAWYALTWALTLVGCPVITIPCGLDHMGMPFGIQIVGKRHGDGDLLRFAYALEAALQKDGLSRVVPQL